MTAIGLIGWEVMGEDVSVLPLKFPEFLLHPLAIFLSHPFLDDTRCEGLHLVLLSIQAKEEVGVHGSVDIQAGKLEGVWVPERGSVDRLLVNRVSPPFVTVWQGFVGGPAPPCSSIVIFVHHDGPGRGRGMCSAGVAPPVACVGAIGEGT